MKIIIIAPKQLLLILVTLLLTSPSYGEEQVYRWRLAESWPENFPIFGEAVEKMVDYAKALSNGRLIITPVSREIHNRPLGVLHLVKTGQYQMGHSASYYYKNSDINSLFFTTLPFGMIAPEQYAWFYYGGGMELMKKAYIPHGILAFPGGNTGNQMGGWFNKEISSLNDLKGLKMRVPGLAGDVMKSLGVKTVNLPAGDLYEALVNGELDALEWVGPSMDIGMRFQEAAQYYYTGWHEPGTELQFMVNQDAYASLPKDLQDILAAAMRLAAYDTYILSYHANAENLYILQRDYPHIKIRAFPTQVMRALSRETENQLNLLAEKGEPLTQEILSSIRTYQQKARVWTRISDQAYLNNAGI